MRDLCLVGALTLFLILTLRYPYAGMLTWGWLTFMAPHQMSYGFARTLQLNLIATAVTIVALLLAKEKWQWPRDPVPKLMLLFVAWFTFDSWFAADPDWSWTLWEKVIKIYVFIFMAMCLMNSKARLQAMICILALSIGFFGVKGGVYTITHGGSGRVWGPENTIIYDNNHLALAIVFVLPMTYYLASTAANRVLRYGLYAALPLQIAAVCGSYSRGGIIALLAMLGMLWLRSRQKLKLLLAGLVIVAGVLSIMPPKFYQRMDTVKTAEQDDSFMGRVVSWQVCTLYAIDHFPFGAGFAGTERRPVYNYYFPNEQPHAAHSIYFQVLGEHGFPALALYLAIALMAFYNTRVVIRACRNRPELAWAGEMAAMIQVSLVGFFVGGGALSMAYYDGMLILIAAISALRHLVTQQTTPAVRGRKPPGRSRLIPPDGARDHPGKRAIPAASPGTNGCDAVV